MLRVPPLATGGSVPELMVRPRFTVEPAGRQVARFVPSDARSDIVVVRCRRQQVLRPGRDPGPLSTSRMCGDAAAML